jgi:serine phosphatase RsbU (regulator of sigma subunit)
VAIIPISWKILKNNFKPGRYFLTAFLFLIIGVLLFVLRNLGLIESNIITEHGIQIGSGFEVVLLTFAIIDKFKSFKDESLQRLKELNKIKEDANEVLEQQVADRTKSLQKSNELIKQQKNSLEDQNLQITSSITYAQKIQLSILPEFSTLKEGVTDVFVSFLPKDIVSGDFYWKNNINQQQFFSVIDCTGHGVPGAFMSMIGYTLLNQIVNEQQITEPKDILNKLRDEIIYALKQSEEGSSQKDGMDLSLIAFHPESNTIKFAGANNPLYIIRSKENDIIVDEEIQEAKVILDQNKLYELKANKQPVGYYTNESITFTQQEIKVQKGDRIYLFTDGFVDQFGGELGKKIKSKTFRKLLLESSQKPLNEQKQILENFLTQWINHPNLSKNEQFQVDDVCIMGIEI